MRHSSSSPLGPLPTLEERPETTPTLTGPEREAALPRLRVVLEGPENETLLEDDAGQAWVDRPLEAGGRELARVSWREVCLNWPDAMCRPEAGEP